MWYVICILNIQMWKAIVMADIDSSSVQVDSQPSLLAWSERWQLFVTDLPSLDELLRWLYRDDSTENICISIVTVHYCWNVKYKIVNSNTVQNAEVFLLVLDSTCNDFLFFCDDLVHKTLNTKTTYGICVCDECREVYCSCVPPPLQYTASELWCLSGGKRGDYQNCTVLYCVLKLRTVISTLRWAVLTVLWFGFCHIGPISLCVDLFVFVCICVFFVSYCIVVVSLWARWGGPDGIEA